MRIAMAAILAIVAVPALAANGNGQGPSASVLKGGNSQSAGARELGQGSVPIHSAAGGAAGGSFVSTTPGNGNSVPGIGNGLIRSAIPGGSTSGEGEGGGTVGGMPVAGGSGGGLGMVSGGGAGGGGVVLDPALFEDPSPLQDLSLDELLDVGFQDEMVEIEPDAGASAIVPVPVPAGLPMLGLGLLAMSAVARRRGR